MGERAVIIGASHAGSQLALSLRQSGWTSSILLVTDENHLPYHRPPLSKDFLSGNKSVDDILIRPHTLYQKNNIEFLFNTTVTAINRHDKTLAVDVAGKENLIPYNKLALCTGARVRKLPIPGVALKGVHYLRNINDVEIIRADLPTKATGVIVGGGYIGLETAAMLSTLGHQITVLEAAPQLLARVAAKEMGDFYHQLHQTQGVRLLTDAMVTDIKGSDRVKEITLANNENINCDFVVIGIGVLPNEELAAQAGLDTSNGIVVNDQAQSSDPDIVAAGDCTRFNHPIYGDVRLESVPNATEQAKIAAATLCGKEKSHASLPWFWSDQYACKLQIAGLSQGYDQIILRGSNKIIEGVKPSFCVFYFQHKKLIAADCINRPREFMLSKMWLQNGHSPDITKLMDEDRELTKED